MIWNYRHALKGMARQVSFGLKHRFASEEWVLACPMGLGDTFYVCGFAAEILKQHGGTRVTVLVKPRHLFIPSLFPAIGRVVPVPNGLDMRRLSGRDWRAGRPFYAHCQVPMANLLGHNATTLLDCYRALLSLPMTALPTTPRHPNIQEVAGAARLFDDLGLPTGKTVVLAPETNSTKRFAPDQWGLLADVLQHAGWTPVMSVSDTWNHRRERSPSIPLALMIPFVERAGWVISARSGLVDLLASARCRLTVLYPEQRWYAGSVLEGSSMRRMGLSDRVAEFELNDIGADEITQILATAPGSQSDHSGCR